MQDHQTIALCQPISGLLIPDSVPRSGSFSARRGHMEALCGSYHSHQNRGRIVNLSPSTLGKATAARYIIDQRGNGITHEKCTLSCSTGK